MPIKSEEINTDNAFENCKLGRKKYADVLTSLIGNYPEGFVLAINNKWGTGKTTFLRMWKEDLKQNEFQTIYFNAWENDFENNPLIALMGELKTMKGKNEAQFTSTLKKAAKLSQHLVPTLVKAVAEKYISTETVKQAIEDVSKGFMDIFENEVKEYSERKKSIKEFRDSLSKLIADTTKGKPLVFIVDELDRCRPNYAVLILEQIKHFFSVPNIVFVLSIDKEQLGNAICGVYGSEKIDSDEYLKRFIDIEYSLPDVKDGTYYKFLYEQFHFEDFFKLRSENRALQGDKSSFLRLCDTLFGNGQITLRQQEKIFANARLTLKAFRENQFMLPSLFIYLNYLKLIKPDFFKSISSKSYNLEELQKNFLEDIKSKINDDNINDIIWLEAFLLNSYNNSTTENYGRNKLFIYDNGEYKLLVKSVIDKSQDGTYFLDVLQNMQRYERGIDVKIDHLLNKINLIEGFAT